MEAFANISLDDERYIARCLQLARCGAGSTSPNPMVGAVAVCDGKIIGEGYHIRCGEAHAEVNAINSVRDRSLLSRSTIYVSLEPCSHYGKTPPCADLIISCGIPRVVVAVTDNNSMVSGRGIERMRAAGIDVRVGVLAEQSFRLNRAFFTFHGYGRPFVTLKWAQSVDGFIDYNRTDGKAQIISSSRSAMAVHKLRSQCDAILVGRRTALLDNPSLTLRHWSGRMPQRLVIDKNGTLPSTLALFDGSVPTTVFTSVPTPCNRENLSYVQIDFSKNIPTQILNYLATRNIGSLLVEGGRETLQGFIDAGLWDEIRIETNPRLYMHEGVSAPRLPQGVKTLTSCCFGHIIETIER